MIQLRSPLPWMGGKHYMDKTIIASFPPAELYDVYCEPFLGGAHVIAQKPITGHYEVVNDINGDLINFWLHIRNNPEQLVERLNSLPYSRQLHYDYHASLYDGTALDPLEHAVRWYYVLQSSFSAHLKTTSVGWRNGPRNADRSRGQPHAFHSAIELFTLVAERFRHVEIDNRDFEKVIRQHDKPRTLFYVDPPYLGCEDYYRSASTAFSSNDHQRLATVLNNSQAYVALSYYPHPLLDELYPADKWRRVTWSTFKHSQRTKEQHDEATELLLMNYQPASASLWSEEVAV